MLANARVAVGAPGKVVQVPPPLSVSARACVTAEVPIRERTVEPEVSTAKDLEAPEVISMPGMELVLVTGGTMGSPLGEHERNDDEGQNEQPAPATVVGINWYEAKAYCDWAGLTLPTEARASSVATKGANPWGLLDMNGNVLQWMLDGYEPYTSSVRAGDGSRNEPAGEAVRVMRGGFYADDARNARSASRSWSEPGHRWRRTGGRPTSLRIVHPRSRATNPSQPPALGLAAGLGLVAGLASGCSLALTSLRRSITVQPPT